MKLKFNPVIENLTKMSYAGSEDTGAEVKLDCSMGSNPYGFSDKVRIAAGSLTDADISDYPHGEPLRRQIREYWKPLAELKDEQIVLCDGGVHGLTLVNMLFQKPGAVAVGIRPQFSEYVTNAGMLGYEYRAVPLSRESNYEIRTDDIIELIDDDTSLVYIDNPHNPTGQALPLSDIRRLLEAAARHGAAVLVDEAYVGFLEDARSAITLVSEYENLIVVHTFSKSQGLAGLHAGYIVAGDAICTQLKKVNHEYACAGVSRLLSAAALSDRQHSAACRVKIAGTKNRLAEAVKWPLRLAKTEPSVPICMVYHADESVDLTGEFLKRGICVISGRDFEGLQANCVRIRVPQDENETLLLDAVRELAANR